MTIHALYVRNELNTVMDEADNPNRDCAGSIAKLAATYAEVYGADQVRTATYVSWDALNHIDHNCPPATLLGFVGALSYISDLREIDHEQADPLDIDTFVDACEGPVERTDDVGVEADQFLYDLVSMLTAYEKHLRAQDKPFSADVIKEVHTTLFGAYETDELRSIAPEA